MLQTLLDQGLDYHDSESERLAGELEAAAAEATPAQLAPLLKLTNHTIGEHLADWPRARRLAERVMAGREADAESAGAWARLAVARFLDGDAASASAAELVGLAASGERLATALIEARVWLVGALVGAKRRDEAAAIYTGALTLARRSGDAAPVREIAVASNNIAAELVEAASRSPAEDALMRVAAEAAHEFWRACGTWVNEERALHLEAQVANELGASAAALAHAEAGLAIIEANGEAPVDAAFLRLARARALGRLGEAEASARDLALADAAASGWDDEGLQRWFAEERAKAL